MNDDYLWDRTGEADPEIQELEQILGTLRYQPRPIELRAHVRSGHRRTLFSGIAIAAVLATVLVGAASWWLLQKQIAPVGLESGSNIAVVEKFGPAPENLALPATDEAVARSAQKKTIENKPELRGARKTLAASNRQSRTRKTASPELATRDRAEAEAAKDQLLLALRVASSKLSLAQKKAQGGYPGTLLHNQHKVG